MPEQCENCMRSSCFSSGYYCFKLKKHVENESTCESWRPRKTPTKENMEHVRSISELSLATRNL